jgi:predicted molibdopterin-dependent oxidoreductase YjgC
MESVGLLFVSGDEAANDPNVRALAEKAEAVIAVSMFQSLVAGWADLVLPGTSYLERDGTYVNLEGRLQRLRRAAIPPSPDELTWLSTLASRFGVELPPYTPSVFAELSHRIYGDLSFGEVGERAPLRVYAEAPEHVEVPPLPEAKVAGDGLRLVCYKPLFSGPAVERVEELQFQRPPAEVELAREDAKARGITNGAPVTVSHNGTSVQLRARIAKDLRAGVVRIAHEHAGDLRGMVEVSA